MPNVTHRNTETVRNKDVTRPLTLPLAFGKCCMPHSFWKIANGCIVDVQEVQIDRSDVIFFDVRSDTMYPVLSKAGTTRNQEMFMRVQQDHKGCENVS